jgi:hypothetical protein
LLSLSVGFATFGPASRVVAAFTRGDGNQDGRVDVADPVSVLKYLFAGQADPTCADAADSTDDGELSIADAIRTLQLLFLGGENLPAPFPEAGEDPTEDSLLCGQSLDPGEPLDAPGFPWLGDALRSDAENRDSLPTIDPASPDDGGLIAVDEAAFEALSALAPGSSLLELAGMPGLDPLLPRLLSAVPAAEFPIPIGSFLRVPIPSSSSCWQVDAELLDGGSFDPGARGLFRRGDVNGDGSRDAADVDRFARCLGRDSGPSPDCWRSCGDAWDVNDDGKVDRLDYDRLRTAVAYAATTLPAPDRSCGRDPTPDRLPDCEDGDCYLRGRLVGLRAWPEELCGPGTHEVTLTATSSAGLSRDIKVAVTLCVTGEGGCPVALERSSPDVPNANGALDTLQCRWFGVFLRQPQEEERSIVQRTYTAEGKPLTVHQGQLADAVNPSLNAVRIVGPGPMHHLVVSRLQANCRTPKDSSERRGGGLYKVGIHHLCFDRAGVVQSPPCYRSLRAEGFYSSELRIETASSSGCGPSVGRVESLALDEAAFSANGELLFAKGVSLQNGNLISTATQFELGVSTAVTPQSAGGFLAKFGVSRTVADRTGKMGGTLRARASFRTESFPVVLLVESEGTVRIQGESRTLAYSRVSTDAVGLWFLGLSSCPGSGNFPGLLLRGYDDGLRLAKDEALLFFATHLAGSDRRALGR